VYTTKLLQLLKRQLPPQILSEFNSEKYENWYNFAEVIVKIKVVCILDTVYSYTTHQYLIAVRVHSVIASSAYCCKLCSTHMQ